VKNHFELDRDQKRHLRFEALRGVELVPNVSRLCGMNLYLHGIGPDGADDRDPPIHTDDALRDEPGAHADVVVTNPPFGKKSSITVVNEEGESDRQTLTYNRPDFWTTTSNKQLNFVQHVKSLLKVHGRAAVVVPDNVLFEGGAGETVRRNLLQECEVHTLLRLPTGIFYAQGVKANVPSPTTCARRWRRSRMYWGIWSSGWMPAPARRHRRWVSRSRRSFPRFTQAGSSPGGRPTTGCSGRSAARPAAEPER